MKKSNILIAIILVIVLGVGSFAVYKFATNDKPSEKELEKDNKDNNNLVVSEESIQELNKTIEKRINTDFYKSIDIDNPNGTKSTIKLLNESGKLYLSSDSYKSEITGISDKVVFIVDAQNGCSLPSNDILILTSKGDLYVLKGANSTEKRFENDIISKLKSNKEVNLNIQKLNKESEKVLGITEYYHNGACNNCGEGTVAVYTSNKKYKLYDTFEEITNFEATAVCGGELDVYMTIYEDGTAKTEDGKTLKDKNGDDLIIKDSFRQGETGYLIDNNEYLYTLKSGANGTEVKLYRDSKIKKVDKSSSKVTIEFETGSNLNVDNIKNLD